MPLIKKTNFLFEEVSKLKGVGPKLTKYLKKKNIEKIYELLWDFPYSSSDRGQLVELNKIEIGKILTIKVRVKKYNFPRIRNLPNKVLCEDDKGKIEIVFFNSREGFLKKIMPLNKWITLSGKINFYKNKYQMTNPEIINKNNTDKIVQILPKYSLTSGLNEKLYRKIIENVLDNLPEFDEWHSKGFLKDMNFDNWCTSIKDVHNISKEKNFNSNSYRRLAYDEILSQLLVLSNNRKKIRRNKKKPKKFTYNFSNIIIDKLDYELTISQKKVLNEIEKDLISKQKMFRIIQGDVGSGKTIVSMLSIANTISANYQCAFMAPTEILAKQHFNLAKKIFKGLNIRVEFISGKVEYKIKKKILKDLEDNKIDLIIGTHSLFQKKVLFKNLGLIIVDEQHKFGVKQRMNLAKKGGKNCDVLLMSATPIPRTMMLAMYGDMDISKITEKPKFRKPIITLSKPEEKITELWSFIRKQINNKNQIFWVCPLIKESKILNYSSAIKRFEYINKKFSKKAGLIHGSMDKSEREDVLQKFLEKKIDILVSTTVIEVGIDFPNANLIIIENANKFGLAQLHQLRGRVGRGDKQGICILLFKGSLSKNSIKRIKILKSTDDGFVIAEEDMKLRGYGDIIGFQQSGLKYFKIADPVHHKDLFEIAEKNFKNNEEELLHSNKYQILLKLFDRAEVINDD
ncbi:MAG: ATP-dependent DNA helicase RecG [Pelagibacteraceae bacterium]